MLFKYLTIDNIFMSNIKGFNLMIDIFHTWVDKIKSNDAHQVSELYHQDVNITWYIFKY